MKKFFVYLTTKEPFQEKRGVRSVKRQIMETVFLGLVGGLILMVGVFLGYEVWVKFDFAYIFPQKTTTATTPTPATATSGAILPPVAAPAPTTTITPAPVAAKPAQTTSERMKQEQRLIQLKNQEDYSPSELKELSLLNQKLKGKKGYPLVTSHKASDGRSALTLESYMSLAKDDDLEPIRVTRKTALKNIEFDIKGRKANQKRGVIAGVKRWWNKVRHVVRKNRCADYISTVMLGTEEEPSTVKLIGRLLLGGARVVINPRKAKRGDIYVQTRTAWHKGRRKRISYRSTHVAAVIKGPHEDMITVRDHVKKSKRLYAIRNRQLNLKREIGQRKFLMIIRLP